MLKAFKMSTIKVTSDVSPYSFHDFDIASNILGKSYLSSFHSKKLQKSKWSNSKII